MKNPFENLCCRARNIFDLNQRIINSLVYVSISLLVILLLLYYYLRFQFDLVNVIPLGLYGLTYGLILFSFFYVLIQKGQVLYTEVDLWVFVFLFYNIILLPMSFAKYGMIEGLYAIKNYLTGMFLYFAVILFFNKKRSQNIIKFITIICTVVSAIYLAELTSVRFMSSETIASASGVDIVHSGGLFKYTANLDRYALQKAPTGHGLSKSWSKSDTSLFVRLPGPLGHSNATAFVIAIGSVLSFSLIVFGTHRRGSIIFFLLCLVALFWGCSRTNMLSSIMGISFVSIVGTRNKKIKTHQLVFFFIAALLLIVILILFKIIDWSAYSQIFNWEQTLYTFRVIFSENILSELWVKMTENPIAFVFGYGFAPVLPQTYISSLYNGYPMISDDTFFVQFLSQYGIVVSLMFFIFLFYSLWNSYRKCKQCNLKYFNSNLFGIAGVLAVIVASFLTFIHGGSLFRPQINPVIFILLGAYSVIIREGAMSAIHLGSFFALPISSFRQIIKKFSA